MPTSSWGRRNLSPKEEKKKKKDSTKHFAALKLSGRDAFSQVQASVDLQVPHAFLRLLNERELFALCHFVSKAVAGCSTGKHCSRFWACHLHFMNRNFSALIIVIGERGRGRPETVRDADVCYRAWWEAYCQITSTWTLGNCKASPRLVIFPSKC